MATRKRRPLAIKTSVKRESVRNQLRRSLLERLEQRQLLAAGPQLIGIQPNEGALIDGGVSALSDPTVLNVSPRTLTFRFDDGQQIHPDTLDGIRIVRAGLDGELDTADDIRVQPGSVLVGNPNENEVIVRFAETLADDRYRIEVFAFDDATSNPPIVGLRNSADDGSPGELLITRTGDARKETREFDLRLGALVQSVVPQPVVRQADNTLVQQRNQVVVYFNEPLFIEADPATGEPTDRSANNPRFYQLLYTRDSVRNTDDILFLPERVDYDAASQTATLVFAKDLEALIRENVPNGGVGGGTYRLRVGSAVNLPAGVDGTLGVPTFTAGDPGSSIDLFFEPDQSQTFVSAARSTLRTSGEQTTTVEFQSAANGQGEKWNMVRFTNSGLGGLAVAVTETTNYFDVVVDLGGTRPTVQQVVDEINAIASARVNATIVSGSGASIVGEGLPAMEPIRILSDSFSSAYQVGVLGSDQVTSLLFNETISAVPYTLDLIGGPNDPASRDLIGRNAGIFADYINRNFSVDVDNQIKTIEYNFGVPGVGRVNSITDEMKDRVREALDLWSQHIAVRFVETPGSGWTVALETPSSVPAAGRLLFNGGLAAVVPDASFNNGVLVLDALHQWQVGYGEDFFRTTFAGVGALLGLGQAGDLPPSTVMALSSGFINDSIDQLLDQQIYNQVGSEFTTRPLEPIFAGNYDIQHASYLHGAIGSDIDLYRFEVDVTTGSNTGLLTVETFAQRLPDSSTLDTSLKLFKQTQASVSTNFSLPVAPIVIEALAPGKLGNQTTISFVRSFRDYVPPSEGLSAGQDAQRRDDNRAAFQVEIVQTGVNAFTVDVPFVPDLSLLSEADKQAELEQVGRSPADILRAIQGDVFASSLVKVIDQVGDGFAMLDDAHADAETNEAFREAWFDGILSKPELAFDPLVLSGGDIEPIAFNDDYFGTDSRIQMQLEDGVYYIGVASTGNDEYDAVIPGTGFGGRTLGDYQLFVKFEATADGRDTLRDLDANEVGVPGTPLDGDGDGVAGGANNFWFQVRPESRQLEFDGGAAIVPGATMAIVSGPNGVTRTYQFILVDAFDNPITGQPPLGNGRIAIRFRDIASSAQIAQLVASVINGQTATTQVSAIVGGFAGADNVVTLDNERSVTFSADFNGVEVHGKTIFVDKIASAFPDGSANRPFNNISSDAVPSALRSTHPGDIVRIVGNGGNDRNPATELDNFAYRIGYSETGGLPLEDGTLLNVPQGVTVMVDAGAIFKLRNSRVGVGSSNLQLDRSGAALQILGTPRLLDSTGALFVHAGTSVSGEVIFTSTRDQSVSQTSTTGLAPGKGDWGGLELRRDVDDSFGRANLEDQGIFLNHINFADIRYGGGSNVLVDADQVTVNPIQIVDTRPTITFNRISNSADAAMSAAPNSFEEVSYQSPRYQAAGSFTADYDRVGPDIHHNLLSDNTLNGLFILVRTNPGEDPVVQTISGRWDDTDIVHILSENLVLDGNPGGSLRDTYAPDLQTVTTQVRGQAGDVAAGSYRYRMTMVDAFGFESLASGATPSVTVALPSSQVALAGLPQVPTDSNYRFRRLYRSSDGITFELVAELNAFDTSFVDRLNQDDATSVLDLGRSGERGRPASSLAIDPGTVVKIQGSRIEVGFGAQLLAEGVLGREVIFTSIMDDRYGAGGSFDTNNDGEPTTPLTSPQAADWAGIYASPTSNISLDNAVVAYAGGLSRIEGTFKAFSPIELQQATARLTNTVFESNADGIGGQGPTGRFGRLANTPATIFVRGGQPVIVGNTFVGNEGSVIDIDANSLTADLNIDVGRQSGSLGRIAGLDDNRGPLIRRNLLDNNDLNGMEIRGATLTTESVWDDTDIVHVLYDSIIVGNFHGSGNLRLQSNPNESLVVKLLGPGSPFSDTTGTGFTITGEENDLVDRIGGSLNILGRPGFPVVLTSLLDDSVGAGRKPDGTQQTDTNNDAFATRPDPNDWRSVFLDQTSSDRNVSVQRELELQTDQAPGINGIPATAQVLGELAGRVVNGDDLRRLGFDVEGFLSESNDVDVYQFRGEAGSEIWIDLDRTTMSLDTVVELLDANGTVLARSTNSADEVFDEATVEAFSSQLTGRVGSLAKGSRELLDFSTGGEYYDFGSSNPRDAGFRVILPGAVGNRGPYFVRIRSNSVNPDDAAGGLTSGSYRFQVRLGEAQEFAGSSINFADIRYANHGIHTKGLPGSSPLLGEAQENENVSFISSNDQIAQDPLNPGRRPQYLGNLLDANDRTVSVGGTLSSAADVDFYRIKFEGTGTGPSAGGVIAPAVFDIDYADGISRPDTNMSVFYSPSGNPVDARLVLFSSASNISEDRSGFLASLSEDIFAAGSTGAGDPFIGPVALPEGAYFVAVTNGSRVPTALSSSSTVRREPVNSVRRLIEERFYTAGDPVVLTSAEDPVFTNLFDLGALPAGFTLNTSRAGDPGHGIGAAFDGSRVVTDGGRSLHADANAIGAGNTAEVESSPFSLAGYSAADLPVLYFNYLFNGGADDVRVEVTSPSGTTVVASTSGGGTPLANDVTGQWRQVRFNMASLAGQSNLRLRIVYEAGGAVTGEGFFMDDIVLGFAERGEMVVGASIGESSFGGGIVTGVTSGEYQLEVRPATNYFTPNPAFGRLVTLQDAFDTNDRHASAITIVAPSGAELVDGYNFQLGDGSRRLIFEFDELTLSQPSGSGVGFGRIRVPFTATDSPAAVASALRTAINTAVQQNSLRIKASTSSGDINGATSDGRINLYGPVAGDFVSITESTVPVPVNPEDPNAIRLPATFFDGLGDQNAERAQGQIIIDSNRISDVKVYGIWSDPGDRLIDDTDDVPFNPYLENLGLNSPALGAVRNLPTSNDSVIGGLAPGLVVQNNVIDRAGYVGVQIQGMQRPLMIEAPLDGFDPDIVTTGRSQLYLGSSIPDGSTFAIDAGGTRVVFEFEDISGTDLNNNPPGSVDVGGDGWQPGHVPVYYRIGGIGATSYNGPAPQRVYASTRMEVMHAIRDAIIGSILVTNDLVPLVDVWVGPSLIDSPLDSNLPIFGTGLMAYPTATLFINGASGIHFTGAFSKNGGTGPLTDLQAPVQEAVQPFARVINNTIYGSDGSELNYAGLGTVEPNDQLANAVDTKLGRNHNVGPYVSTGTIGDSSSASPAEDIDMYRFHLGVGDRVQADLSSLANGPDVALRLFNSRGEVQTFEDAAGQLVDVVRTGLGLQTASIDFTSVEADSYYIGISSVGNEAYDPRSFADRVPGEGGTGQYSISIDVLAPRTHVLSLQQVLNFANLIGTTFTIEQVADLPGQTTNSRTFEFVEGAGGLGLLPNGNVPVHIFGGQQGAFWRYRTSDVMRAIAAAINGVVNNVPRLPNHEFRNGPGGISGPITRVEAVALGGIDGWDGDSGLSVFPGRPASFGAGNPDSQNGFGHNRTSQVGSDGIDRTFTDGAGTSENYVLIKNAARVIVNNESILGVDPQPDRNMDQLLPEVGIMARDGASPSLLNNVILNTQAAIESEVTRRNGFGTGRGENVHPKKGQVIVGGTVFQHTETVPALFQDRMTWPGVTGAGTETDRPARPSNVNGGTSDFNLLLPGSTVVLVNPANNEFTPAAGSIAIDSSINSLAERDAFASLKLALGMPVNPLLSPARDVTGQLRVDDPEVFFTGLGSNVFKDRGAAERADFVGPVAVIINPFDNDSAGNDVDPNVSFVQMQAGVVSEFRIQLRDSGDASDPFQGSGVDDGSVVGPFITGVRNPGAVLTLFENGRMLEEGIDYQFSYDETNKVITLRPLAGIWRQESIYEIELNNKDRFVATAPAGPQINDGEQFVIVDDQGGRVTFEYDAGHQLDIPEVITLRVPAIGTGAGGIRDGNLVRIKDGLRDLVFEFTTELDSVQAGNLPVLFQIGNTPNELITSLKNAIQAKIDDGTFSVNIPGVGPVSSLTLADDGTDGLRIGMEAGGIVNASSSALIQADRTLAFEVPSAGVGRGGIAEGDTFVISDGLTTLTFEFDTDNIIGGSNVPVDLRAVGVEPNDVIRAILDAIDTTELRIREVQIDNDLLFLGLPGGGHAEVIRGNLAAVSLARTLADGGTVTLTPEAGSPVVFELNRTDEAGTIGGDGVAAGNQSVSFTRTTSADELSLIMGQAIRNVSSLNLDPSSPGSGVLIVGGDETLSLRVDNAPNLLVTAQPGVTDKTTLIVSGPLVLQTPIVGGGGVIDGSSFTITANGVSQLFSMNLVNGTAAQVPNSIEIDYLATDDSTALSQKIAAAINGSPLGITATEQGGGRIALGPLDFAAVDVNDTLFTLARGVVSDGEIVRISQGGTTLIFEFEEAGTGGGVGPTSIPVLFNTNSTADDVARDLAAAINNNGSVFATDVRATAQATGLVRIEDNPQTVVDVSQAPTLSKIGVAGGAIPVRFVQAASFTAEDVKRSLIEAINSADNAFTSLTARDRGGNTFFIENAVSVEEPMVSFFLPAITDVVGLPLKANREDGTTRFTLMLPTVEFDYGDAPDPQGTIQGRYPTLIASDGARHIITPSGPRLGSVVDPEADGQPLITAKGDDSGAYVIGTPSPSMTFTRTDTLLNLVVGATVADGDTVRIATVTGVETFELDSNNIFSEENIPVRFLPTDSVETIATKLATVIRSSSLQVAGVAVPEGTTIVSIVTNDDDGVQFGSPTNPAGVFNPNISTEITVTVTGIGFVEGWIDFNGDGDWDDPGEQIDWDPRENVVQTSEFFSGLETEKTRTLSLRMPSTAPVPTTPFNTYARFRVSTLGNLSPSGLAIDGEVEDYQVRIVPGSPPVIEDAQVQRSYTVDEDQRLLGQDPSGLNSPSPNDNGVLAGIMDPDGDAVVVFPTGGVETIEVDGNEIDFKIVGVGTSMEIYSDGTADGSLGGVIAGELTLNADGRFTFDPVADYFGDAIFRVRVKDDKGAGNEDLELVAQRLLTVTITVNPINDAPKLIDSNNDTTTITDHPEDQVLTFTAADLINGKFVAGPDNESGQGMQVQTAGFGGVANVTRRGGTLQITSDGNVIYTPPLDFSGPGTDEFVYTVVDLPGNGLSPQQSTQTGKVIISFVPVNDPPIAGPDTFPGQEDNPTVIPIGGSAGILGNDVPGPQDEINAGQFVSLVANQFPITTVRGGRVELQGLNLVYTPRRNFAGSDSFQYQVTDNASANAATSLGTVTINVAGENDGADFAGPTALTYSESKGSDQTYEIDLNTWFTDPEGDALRYEASAANGTLVQTSVNGNILRLTLPQDRSGQTVLTVTALNPGDVLPVSANVTINVTNVPDPPRRTGLSLNPTNTNEDVNVTRDLSQYFTDPDGDPLTYTVITPQGQTQPFDRNLVQSVAFNGDQMVITLVPNAFGSTNITMQVSDGTFAITDTFTLNVTGTPDTPVGVTDNYQVPIRGRLVVSDPRVGVLANDREADGDTFTVDLASVVQPLNGSVTMNANGTFTYTNLSNSVPGSTDTFSYRAIDKDGRSAPVTVTILLTGSTHQNPNNNLDVNADGSVSPIDSLRIINLLNRDGRSAIPIRDLAAPPDFYDTNGNGIVVPLDALAIINFLNRNPPGGEGEGFDARLATTTAWVSAGTANLPQSSFARSTPVTEVDPPELLENRSKLATEHDSWQIVDGHIEDAIESLVCSPEAQNADGEAADQALADILADFDFGPSMQ